MKTHLSPFLTVFILLLAATIPSFAQNELFDTAQQKMNRKDFRGAAGLYTQAIKLNPSDPKLFYYRAEALRKTGDLRGAIRDWTKSIILDPRHSGAFYNRGRAYYELKDYRRALQDFSKAIAIDSLDIYAVYNRALVFLQMRDIDKALQEFDRYLRFEPNDPSALYNRATILEMKGLHSDASRDFELASRLDSTLWKKVPKAPAVQQKYNRQHVTSPVSPTVNARDAAEYYSHAKEKGRRGDNAGALADFTRAIELNPSLGWAYYNRGHIFISMGNRSSACNDFSKAAGLGVPIASSALAKYCR